MRGGSALAAIPLPPRLPWVDAPRGADTDTMVASARAYLSALNKLAVKRERLHAQAQSA